MEIRHLKYFLAVAKELNFTKASEKLNISQPPLSRQIKELENEIGAQLFVRTNKKVALTDSGLYFREQVTDLLHSLDTAVVNTKKLHENVSGEYKIAYISSTFSSDITELVKFLTQKHPFLNIKLYEVSTAKQIKALEQNKIDIGILRAPVTSTKLKTTLWYKDGYSLVYNNTIINEIQDLSQLKDEVFVFFNKEYAPTYYNTLLEICALEGFKPKIVHESNNINSILQLVKNGLGISIVPSCLARNNSDSELSFMPLNKNFYTDVLIARPRNQVSEITNTALEYLVREK